MSLYASYPDADGALAGAVGWLEGVMLGSVGTTVAVLAVAAVGVLMLGGRLPVKRGAAVVLGCFVLFGAATISGGILGFIQPEIASSSPDVVTTPAYQATIPKPVPYDPYAGASVPAAPVGPIGGITG